MSGYQKNKHLLSTLSMVMVAVSIVTAVLGFYSTSFGGLRPKLYGDADMLIIPSLYSDVENGVDITGWRIPPATYFFPDIVFYFLIRSLTGSMFTALPIYGLLQYGLFVTGLVIFARQIFPDDYKQKSFAIISVMSILFLYFYEYIHFANQAFLTVHHFGVLVVIPWALALVYRLTLNPHPNLKFLVVLSGLSALASFSDSFYVVQFAAPISGSLIVLVIMHKLELRRVLRIIIAIGLGSVLGYAGFAFLSSKDPALDTYLGLYPLRDIVYRYMDMVDHFMSTELSHFLIVLIYAGICVLTVVREISTWLFPKRSSSSDTGNFLYALYFLMGGGITVVTLAVSGITIDRMSFRYFLPFVLLPAFLGIPFVLKFPKSTPLWAIDLAMLVMCVVLIFASVSKIESKQLIHNVTADYYPEYVKCIDEHAEELGLSYGIAQYWQARPITELSNKDLKVVQVQRDLSVYYWCSNKYWYEIQPEFIVINQFYEEPSAFRLDEELIIERYGVPDTVFTCERSKVLVYSRENSELHTIFDEYLD